MRNVWFSHIIFLLAQILRVYRGWPPGRFILFHFCFNCLVWREREFSLPHGEHLGISTEMGHHSNVGASASFQELSRLHCPAPPYEQK